MDDPNAALKHAVEVVGRDPFASLLGISVEEARESYARTSIVLREKHCNADGRTHGGVLFSVADQAFAVAAHASGCVGFAMEVKINFFEATRPGDVVYAEAVPLDIRKKVSLWNVELTNRDGARIAFAQGLAYHKAWGDRAG